MPENLTTWKIRGWTLAPGTRVGEGEAEIVTTKNLLRADAGAAVLCRDGRGRALGHRAQPSEIVQKRTGVIELDGKSLTPLDPSEKTVEVAAGGETRVDWRVRAVEQGEAVVRMKALTDEESDAMEMHFPVRVHGMLKTVAYSGSIRPDRESATFQIAVPERAAGCRYAAGNPLFAQPGGALCRCVAVSRPLSAQHDRLHALSVLADRHHAGHSQADEPRPGGNQEETGRISTPRSSATRPCGPPVGSGSRKIPSSTMPRSTRMVKAGVQALTEMQLADGGWGWFSGWGEHSEPHRRP